MSTSSPLPVELDHEPDEGSRICGLCARANDLADFYLCSDCCYALAQAQARSDIPDGIDNFLGWICHKLGIGTLPIAFVITEEAALTHIMHHYVFLPTPIGLEIAQLSKKVIEGLNSYCPKQAGMILRKKASLAKAAAAALMSLKDRTTRTKSDSWCS